MTARTGLGVVGAVSRQTRALHRLLRVSCPASAISTLPAERVQPLCIQATQVLQCWHNVVDDLIQRSSTKDSEAKQSDCLIWPERLPISADDAQVSKEAADEADHAETNGAAADVSGDDMDAEDMHLHEEGNSQGVTAAGEVSSQPAVLSISIAPDG